MILIVNLRPEQAADALAIARQRDGAGHKVNKKFSDEHTSLGIHYMSALAEVAWEYLTGWEVDREVRPGGDNGIDFTNNHRTYQLKARDAAGYREPDLLVRSSHAQAERFILAEVDTEMTQVSFIGWCTHEELIVNSINLPGKGLRYIRKRDMLRDIPGDIIIFNERE